MNSGKDPKGPQDNPCLLRAFASSNLQTPLPGLERQGRNWVADESLFACCQGLGRRPLPEGGIGVCTLAQRLRSLQRLDLQFQQCWKSYLDPRRLPSDWSSWLEKLGAEAALPSFFRNYPGGLLPSSGWVMAAAAVWRYGYQVHFVSLGRGKDQRLVPDWQDFDPQKTFVFVEGVGELWKPALCQDLETLVSWCHGSGLRLGLFIDQKQGSSAKNSFGAFDGRIRKLRSKPWFEWLDSATRSRLHELGR